MADENVVVEASIAIELARPRERRPKSVLAFNGIRHDHLSSAIPAAASASTSSWRSHGARQSGTRRTIDPAVIGADQSCGDAGAYGEGASVDEEAGDNARGERSGNERSGQHTIANLAPGSSAWRHSMQACPLTSRPTGAWRSSREAAGRRHQPLGGRLGKRADLSFAADRLAARHCRRQLCHILCFRAGDTPSARCDPGDRRRQAGALTEGQMPALNRPEQAPHCTTTFCQ
jgi:hypothetical protein